MFLISLAVGTLSGTALIHLIPQVYWSFNSSFFFIILVYNSYFKAYGIDEDLHYSENHMYAWKSLVISGGLYLFFIIEQVMRFLMQFRKVIFT